MPDPPPFPTVPSNQPPIDLFANIVTDDLRGGAAYATFLETFRTLQDRVVTSHPPENVWDDLAERMQEAADLLEPWWIAEWQRPAGLRTDLPGRGSPLLMPFVPGEESDGLIRGTVVFRPFHVGGNGAAHGGTLPMLFDDVMGHLSSVGGRGVARTAYLKVNYRKITPVEVELQVEATVDRIEGRKRFLVGRLFDDEYLYADAEALFVELKPGQP
jgi:acyl-coenzyme A thioesterase PaaI-like protein